MVEAGEFMARSVEPATAAALGRQSIVSIVSSCQKQGAHAGSAQKVGQDDRMNRMNRIKREKKEMSGRSERSHCDNE